jgi:hypothetical protein
MLPTNCFHSLLQLQDPGNNYIFYLTNGEQIGDQLSGKNADAAIVLPIFRLRFGSCFHEIVHQQGKDINICPCGGRNGWMFCVARLSVCKLRGIWHSCCSMRCVLIHNTLVATLSGIHVAFLLLFLEPDLGSGIKP